MAWVLLPRYNQIQKQTQPPEWEAPWLDLASFMTKRSSKIWSCGQQSVFTSNHRTSGSFCTKIWLCVGLKNRTNSPDIQKPKLANLAFRSWECFLSLTASDCLWQNIVQLYFTFRLISMPIFLKITHGLPNRVLFSQHNNSVPIKSIFGDLPRLQHWSCQLRQH